jgi:hypothetical protein
MALHHFLLVYDRTLGRLIRLDEFEDGAKAAAAYAELERESNDRTNNLEIVLVGADSIETIKRTHSHYFDRVGTPSQYLSGV